MIGGVGFFTLKIFLLSFVIRKGMSWANRGSLSAESGASMKSAVGIAKTAAVITLISIVVFGSIMGAIFHTTPIDAQYTLEGYNPTQNLGQAM